MKLPFETAHGWVLAARCDGAQRIVWQPARDELLSQTRLNFGEDAWCEVPLDPDFVAQQKKLRARLAEARGRASSEPIL